MITLEKYSTTLDDRMSELQWLVWKSINSSPGKPCAECGAPFDAEFIERRACTLLIKLHDNVVMLYAVCDDCFEHYEEFSYTMFNGAATIYEWPKITADVLRISDSLVVGR